MTLINERVSAYNLGANIRNNRVIFSFESESDDCGVKIFSRKTSDLVMKIPSDCAYNRGKVKNIIVENICPEDVSYIFYEKDEEVPDRRCYAFESSPEYGNVRSNYRALLPCNDFNWEDDKLPQIKYNNSLIYLIHPRGFTKHKSSGVKFKGTFSGIVEKIPYLKSIGVTTVELQPSYEFEEIPSVAERISELPLPIQDDKIDELYPAKLNYWGYKNAFYYAPKAGYCYSNDSVTEFKNLVKELHRNNIELIMQFYFHKRIIPMEQINILRFWSEEYHVDGFHIMGEDININLFANDPYLADRKIWYYNFDKTDKNNNLACYNDDYMYVFRRFLKGDENQVGNVMYHLRMNPKECGRIHYLSNYYGFTIMDCVSYDMKHNIENGENNKDGNDYNCSWNCGEEGASRKKKIHALRYKQIKNAFTFLLTTQSTPLIFMGDEFGNSQNGNNNPYCIDNECTWLNWKCVDKNTELLDFWKQLVEMRFSHSLLHCEDEPKVMDYIACGYPDLSYHGRTPWRPETDVYSRFLGLMYCGLYSKPDRRHTEEFLYIAINMHWEMHCFGLPKLPKNFKWEPYICTDDVSESEKLINNTEQRYDISPRSICIFRSVDDKKDGKKKK